MRNFTLQRLEVYLKWPPHALDPQKLTLIQGGPRELDDQWGNKQAQKENNMHLQMHIIDDANFFFEALLGFIIKEIHSFRPNLEGVGVHMIKELNLGKQMPAFILNL